MYDLNQGDSQIYNFCFVPQDGDVDGAPLWPLIYYCLRCGDPKAALQAVQHVP